VSTAAALALVTQFSARSGQSAFTQLGAQRSLLAAQLSQRIASPQQIDQGGSSLCGPADFLYALAVKNPEAYAQYAIDLYEKGSAWIGKMRIAPGSDCRSYLPTGIDAIDWVTLASLRDSSNNLLDYQATGNEAAGITMPSGLLGWFNRSGYFTNVINDTNVFLDKGLSCLLKADQLRAAGASVCLFVNATVLATKRSGGKLTPNHWVVLTTHVKINGAPAAPLVARGSSVDGDETLLGQQLSFDVFTWGGTQNINLAPIKVSEFLDYFYGYISAK
jgi:hypothetical protein